MKKLIISIFILYTLTGCKKKISEPPSENISDESAIKALLEESEWFNEIEGLSDWNPSLSYLHADSFGKFIIHWAREIKEIEKIIDVKIKEDSAFVTVTRNVKGLFHIVGLGKDTFFHITKPMNRSGTRYAIFKRKGGENEKYRGWTLEKTSMYESKSLDTFTVRIDSVKVEVPSQGIVKVYKNPLDLMDVKDILILKPGDRVILSYYTNGENSLAFVHPRFFIRKALLPVGEGIFKGIYKAPRTPGIYHCAFDVIRWESIMEENYPYEDSHIWIHVYKVE